eukprot:GEMP01066136.1.p1 GENE.GEMP01066136.1~~GEMP01066136.1.p1  ORF type:complete len:337 (+),score=58.15 GEMP01066136.1:78-1088(+)
MAPTEIRPFVMVFGGCMSAMIFMEYILKFDAGSGAMITFTEFLFVLLQILPSRFDAHWRPVPLRCRKRNHVIHAALWVTMSWLVNYAYNFNIGVPIHTIFRACNIVASVIFGALFFRVSYTLRQLMAAVAITLGVICGTLGDAGVICGPTGCGGSGVTWANWSTVMAESEDLAVWYVGIAILVAVMCLQSLLGHLQRIFYIEAGTEHQKEVAEEFMLVSAVFAFIPCLFTWSHIVEKWNLLFTSPPIHSLIPIPFALGMVLLNNVTQAICIRGVFYLASSHSPLTVNITLSVRKFLTVITSVVYFNNPWTHMHSLAMVLVFGGAFLYSTKSAEKKD